MPEAKLSSQPAASLLTLLTSGLSDFSHVTIFPLFFTQTEIYPIFTTRCNSVACNTFVLNTGTLLQPASI
jgi:hypothetical protein